jgi:hypothetical protein
MNIWMRLGLFFVCLAIFAFAAVEAFARFPDLYTHKKVIAASLAGGGVLLWIIARFKSNGEDTYQKSDPIFSLQFCGSIFAAFGGIVANVTPISHLVASPQSVLQIQGSIHLPNLPNFFRSESKTAKARSRQNNGSLTVQGIFYKTNDPSAIVNGKTVFVGDTVGAARVVAIERQSVTVEAADGRKVLNF